jgi:hypothetical protein
MHDDEQGGSTRAPRVVFGALAEHILSPASDPIPRQLSVSSLLWQPCVESGGEIFDRRWTPMDADCFYQRHL